MSENLNFEKLFKQIAPEEIKDNVFTLISRIYPVVTVRTPDGFNSMVASGGGMGMTTMKPVTWCMFPSNRYTLELIKNQRTYTLSYFPDEYREQFMLFGKKSGRNSNKMSETELTAMETPLGNMSFAEARLIIECRLTQITAANIEDFYSEESVAFLAKAYNDPGEIRQYVFGEITAVWVKK
jgi:flavin reductase (DIM6/NTAB) family NADH-FMN oxidoreductase RutF